MSDEKKNSLERKEKGNMNTERKESVANAESADVVADVVYVSESVDDDKEMVTLDISTMSDDGDLSAVKRTLDFYEDVMKRGEVLDMTFSKANRVGDLGRYENGVYLCMRSESLVGPFWRKDVLEGDSISLGGVVLKRNYRVCVRRVDRDSRTVYFSEREVTEDARQEAVRIIEENLKKNYKVRVAARVVGVCPASPSNCLVSIADLGIVGIIPIKEWSTTYVGNYNYAVSQSEWVDVVITGTMPYVKDLGVWGAKNVSWFKCSRRLALDKDPWEGIDKLYPANANVRVVCESLHGDGFFGMIAGLKDVYAFCNLKSDDMDIEIRPGKEYIGFIRTVNSKKKKMFVSIVSEV